MSTPAIYYIIYPKGSCGAFISLILAQMMWPKLARIEEFKNRGHADHSTLKYIENLQIVNFMTLAVSSVGDNPYFIKNTEKLTLTERIKYLPNKEKFIFSCHKYPSFSETLFKYPNTKFLIISYNNNMATRLFANIYLKTIDRENIKAEGLDHIEKEIWQKSSARRGKLKNLNIYDFPEWAIQEYAKINSEDDNNNICPTLAKLNTPLPKEFEKYMYRIDMYRIIHDHVNLLEDLSKWCGYPIVPECLPTYENYLTAQKELLPWLDDRLT